jgi:hypothetical protein
MLARVLVRRVVAAQRLAALLASPQMNPARANLDAFFTLVAFRLFDGFDRLDVSA